MTKENSSTRVVFLIKTLKEKYLKRTIEEGRFCFNHPSVFNSWEGNDTARFDRWDAHSSRNVTNIVVAPIIRDDKETIEYGKPISISDKGIVHIQTGEVKQTPICCFRYVERNELIINNDNSIDFSLGEIADRIIDEFGHDSFIMVNATKFLERLRKKYVCMSGGVVYRDTLNGYSFGVDRSIKEIVEQVFRKDERFSWQKEYRIALQPTEDNPVFTELGSIEDISISGKIECLRGIIRMRSE